MITEIIRQAGRYFKVQYPGTAINNGNSLVIIGHSAVGKSTLLDQLHLDRARHDFDVFIQKNGRRHDLDSFDSFLSQDLDIRIFVTSNDVALLRSILRKKNQYGNVIFIYLQRSKNSVFAFMDKKNADGIMHAKSYRESFEDWYNQYDSIYQKIADCVILLQGIDIKILSDLIRPATHGSENNPGQNNVLKSSILQDESYYEDYHRLEKLYDNAPIDIIDANTMRAITAGGYQVFDAGVFPPIADRNSICYKKYSDLQWKRKEFEGRSVVEIGCQLGFFTINSLALGASEAVGFDLNQRFVNEANKIALNYRNNICRWSNDRVKFVQKSFGPKETLPFRPDIIIANSIVHWWIIQNHDMKLGEILEHLRNLCGEAVFFEGCVTAGEKIMQQHDVPLERYNEELFLNEAASIFRKVDFVGHCSYDKQRIVLRLRK